MARFGAGRGLFYAMIPGLVLALLAGCKENLNAPPLVNGADTSGPLVELLPFRDTTVDSTGVLLVSVGVHDPSGIKQVDFFLLPPTFGFQPLTPLDTQLAAGYPVSLGQFKHSTFRYYVRAVDVLDHQTVSDTVTVTVR